MVRGEPLSQAAPDSSPTEGSLWRNRSLCRDCQSLSYKERWHRAAMTERFSPLRLTVRLSFVQPLRRCAPAPLPRGASGETVHFAGTAKASPTRSNGDDRRQWRKQGGAVGAAASRMRAAAKQTLGATTRAVASRQRWRRGCTKTEPFLCRKVRLVASLPVSFC